MKVAIHAALAAASLAVVVSGLVAPAAAYATENSSAAASIIKTEFIPEWYQYCYNIRPVGITAGQSGYINAYSDARGVTCKWWVQPWRFGFPYTTTKYYTWDTVCRYYGSTYSSTRNGMPWCR